VLLDLGRVRGVAELIGATLELLRRFGAVFFTTTAIVVVPTLLVVDGIWGRRLLDGPGHAPQSATWVTTALLGVALPGIVAALHVRVVEALGRGEVPTISQAMDAAAPRLGAAVAAQLIFVACVAIGTIALILPGIWLAVRLFAMAQAVVAEDRSPGEAFVRSGQLVQGRWWATFGTLIVIGILAAVLGGIVAGVADAVHQGIVSTILYLLGTTISASVTALSQTLLYFSLRAGEAGEPRGFAG
jgi:hypothetical protein